MMRLHLLALLLATTILGCGSGSPAVPPDGAPDDGGACPAPADTCDPDGVTLHHCVDGGDETTEVCAWGCVDGDAPHCGVLQPAGGAAVAADTDPAILSMFDDVTINDVIDSDTGKIGAADPAPGSFDNAGPAAIWRFRSLTLQSVLVVGSKPAVLIADGEIRLEDLTNAQDCNRRQTPGGGGFPGGADEGDAGGGGDTGGGVAATSGGGGGANGGPGGAGSDGAAGGLAVTDPEINVLIGGGGGAAGAGAASGAGGGGGGAIQLISNTRIVITELGILNAGGCGGEAGTGTNGNGGGGGAGGTILLEAPEIVIDGLVVANGGGGGGGGGSGSQPGNNGEFSRTAAVGGAGTQGSGGIGAAGGTLAGGDAPAATVGGGGGGGIGRIRFNTRTEAELQITGTLSPSLTDTNSTATAGTAAVE